MVLLHHQTLPKKSCLREFKIKPTRTENKQRNVQGTEKSHTNLRMACMTFTDNCIIVLLMMRINSCTLCSGIYIAYIYPMQKSPENNISRLRGHFSRMINSDNFALFFFFGKVHFHIGDNQVQSFLYIKCDLFIHLGLF